MGRQTRNRVLHDGTFVLRGLIGTVTGALFVATERCPSLVVPQHRLGPLPG